VTISPIKLSAAASSKYGTPTVKVEVVSDLSGCLKKNQMRIFDSIGTQLDNFELGDFSQENWLYITTTMERMTEKYDRKQ